MIAKIIGLTAATLTMFSFVPQVIKMYKCRSARDVSLATIVQLACGVTLWTVYGILQKDPIIILANIITLATLLSALYLYFKFRSPCCRG
jgi:MtN3 and saliva related transmembrane protein